MDALEVLREMHVEAKSTFQKLESASPEERGPIWSKLRPELTAHEQIEERFVYDPVARDAGARDATLSEWEQRHHQEVGEAERLINEIGSMDSRDERFVMMVRQLRETLEQHIATEEGEIWPRIRQSWGQEKLDQVGGQVQAAKTAAAAGATVSGAMGSVSETMKDATRRITGS